MCWSRLRRIWLFCFELIIFSFFGLKWTSAVSSCHLYATVLSSCACAHVLSTSILTFQVLENFAWSIKWTRINVDSHFCRTRKNLRLLEHIQASLFWRLCQTVGMNTTLSYTSATSLTHASQSCIPSWPSWQFLTIYKIRRPRMWICCRRSPLHCRWNDCEINKSTKAEFREPRTLEPNACSKAWIVCWRLDHKFDVWLMLCSRSPVFFVAFKMIPDLLAKFSVHLISYEMKHMHNTFEAIRLWC